MPQSQLALAAEGWPVWRRNGRAGRVIRESGDDAKLFGKAPPSGQG
jgi:hypothetical protein